MLRGLYRARERGHDMRNVGEVKIAARGGVAQLGCWLFERKDGEISTGAFTPVKDTVCVFEYIGNSRCRRHKRPSHEILSKTSTRIAATRDLHKRLRGFKVLNPLI